MEVKAYFDRVCLVNLRRRPDRLEQFQKELEKVDWPFQSPMFVPACDGRAVPQPAYFKGGAGAWGCLRSHSWILEQAMADGVKALLILEDDAFFPAPSTFREDIERFLAAVPQDWDALMFGGQHISGGPRVVKPGVVKCLNCQRTHAYALRGRWLRDLYQTWQTWHTHIDHVMGSKMHAYNVYAPERFLIGQSDSRSDITCRPEKKRLWSKPPAGLPVVLLKAHKTVRDGLANRLHYGYTLDKSGLDVGLVDAFKQRDPRPKLRAWVELVGGEAWIQEKLLGVWHPEATVDLLKQVTSGPVIEVRAGTVQEGLDQLPPQEAQEVPANVVVLLRAKRAVMEELARYGWHRGFWCDPVTGQDNGLRKLLAEGGDNLVPGLRDWIELVGNETQANGGVLAVWHEGVTPELLKQATDRPVVLIEAGTAHDALNKLKEANG